MVPTVVESLKLVGDDFVVFFFAGRLSLEAGDFKGCQFVDIGTLLSI